MALDDAVKAGKLNALPDFSGLKGDALIAEKAKYKELYVPNMDKMTDIIIESAIKNHIPIEINANGVRRGLICDDLPCSSKIEELNCSVITNHYIVRRNIPMKDIFAMSSRQS